MTTPSIAPIPTTYKGIQFRSRLKANNYKGWEDKRK